MSNRQGHLNQTRRRQEARRRPLPGYPREEAPMTLEEVREYFSHDIIECLLCGKPYLNLSIHLIRTHGVPVDDYKISYGLPWGRGLLGQETREKYVEHGRELARTRPDAEEHLARMRAGNDPHAPHRERAPYRVEVGYHDVDGIMDRALALLATGDHTWDGLRESHPDVPSHQWWKDLFEARPECLERFKAGAAKLPYRVLAHSRVLDMPEEFWSELVRLRAEGLPDSEIGAVLGVRGHYVWTCRRRRSIS